MKDILNLGQRVAKELDDLEALISCVDTVLKATTQTTGHPVLTSAAKPIASKTTSLVNLSAQIRGLEASITTAKQQVVGQLITSRIQENLLELTETIESAKHRFSYVSGERLKTVVRKFPDLTNLYAMILAEPEILDNNTRVIAPLTKTRANEDLQVIRETIREAEDQLNSLQTSIGESLGNMMHSNLYTYLVHEITEACEQDAWSLILKGNSFLTSVNSLYKAGRKLEIAYNNNLLSWSNLDLMALNEHDAEQNNTTEELPMSSSLFKDYSKEVLERHQQLSFKLGQQYILYSEMYFHMSLYLRLFVARILTMMDQEKLSTIISSSLTTIAQQTCSALRCFVSKIAELSHDELLHFLNIYLGCAQPTAESTARTYARIKPVFEELFSTLNISVGSFGYNALTVDAMLQIFNAKNHIANIIHSLEPNLVSNSDFKSTFKGLNRAYTLLMQHYIAYLYTSYKVDNNESTIGQTILFCNTCSEPDLSLRTTTITDEVSAKLPNPSSQLSEEVFTLFSRVKPALINAVCYQYSKPFSISEREALARLFISGVFSEDKAKLDIIVNLEMCLRVLKYKEDYFWNSLLSLQDLFGQLSIEQSYLTTQAISIKKRLAQIEQEIKHEVPTVGTSKGVLSQLYRQLITWEDSFKSAHILYLYSAISDISVYVHNYLLDSIGESIDLSTSQNHRCTSAYSELVDILNKIDSLAEDACAKPLFATMESNSIEGIFNHLEDEIHGVTDFMTICIDQIDRALFHISTLEDMIAPERAALNQNELSMSTSLADSCMGTSIYKTMRDQDIPRMLDDASLAPFIDIPLLTKRLFTETEELATTYQSAGAKGLSDLLSTSQSKLSELQARHDAELHLEKRESLEQVGKYITKITDTVKDVNFSVRGSILPLQQINLLLGDALSIANVNIEHSSGGRHVLGSSIASTLTLLN